MGAAAPKAAAPRKTPAKGRPLKLVEQEPKPARRVRRMKTQVARETSSKVPLEEMSDEALLCRADRHKWQRNGDTDITLSRGYLVEFTRHWECEHCGATRWVTYEVPSFAPVRKSGTYPPGYLSSEGRLHPADVKREELTRMGYKVKNIEREAKSDA